MPFSVLVADRAAGRLVAGIARDREETCDPIAARAIEGGVAAALTLAA
jgi:hypothetical protein